MNRRNMSGVTLVELLIAITLGLAIMAGVVQLYATSSRTQKVQEGNSRLQENARYLLSTISRDLAQTGYMGCINFEDADTDGASRITNILTQGTGTGGLYNFDQPLNVTNDAGILGSDSLIVRFSTSGGAIPLIVSSEGDEALKVDKDHVNYDLLEQYQVVVLSDCNRASVFMITNDPTASNGTIEHDSGVTSPEGQSNSTNDLEIMFGSTPEGDGASGSVAYIYTNGQGATQYALGKSNAATGSEDCTAATPQFCALLKNGDEIARGVQDLQIELGWTDGNNLKFDDADGSVDWNEVDRIRISLTLNTIEPVPTASGSQIDTQTFSKTIMLRNQLM